MELLPVGAVDTLRNSIVAFMQENGGVLVGVIAFIVAISFVMAWWDTTHESITWRGKKY